MSKMKSVKIPEEVIRNVEELAKYELMDESSLLHQALQIGLRQLKEKVAVEQVRKGRLTISEASDLVGISVGEMMELLIEYGYRLDLSKEVLDESLKNALEVIK